MDEQTAKRIRNGNIDAIAKHLSAGIKEQGTSTIGIEIEHFIVDAATGQAVSYNHLADGRPGIAGILESLSAFYAREERTKEGELIGLKRPHAVVTLEPGAQLEISIGPFSKISDAIVTYEAFLAEIHPILDKNHYKLVNCGYQPKSKAADVRIIPKQRYAFMDQYLGASGKYGRNMMRCTASTQISIDYHSEEEAMRIVRTASLLGPLFYLLCDNSAVFEGDPAAKRPVRMHVWGDVDEDRAVVFPGVFNEYSTFTDYAEYVYDAPALMGLTVTGGLVFVGALPGNALYAGKEIDDRDVEHMLSLFFFDVRLKNYIEVRMADSLPQEYAFAYAALIRGVFGNTANLDELEELLEGVDAKAYASARKAITKDAYAAEVYGRPVCMWMEKLFTMARASLCPEEKALLAPLEKLALAGKTLADK